jgi:hypothetical protein
MAGKSFGFNHRRLIRQLAFLCGAGTIFALALGPMIGSAVGDSSHGGGHGAMFASLGMKFEGAASCKGAKCHDSGGSDRAPPKATGDGNANLNENLIWAKRDSHAKAFKTLQNEESKKIGAAMGIADVTTAKECLSCHSTHVESDSLKGANFSVAEGNSCNSCHGPSEKWNTPHQTKGWVDDQRKAGYADKEHPTRAEHAKLLAQHGIFDTRPLIVRAELCSSCHLAMDAKMVAAGHPQPKFELDYYTEGVPSNPDYPAWKHWRTDKGGVEVARVWLSGQVVCARDAMRQLADRAANKSSADMVTAAYQQAVAHGTMLAVAMPEFKPALDAVKAAKGDPAKLADAAKSAAETADKMFDSVGKMTFDKASATKLLGGVAGVKGIVADAGPDGHLQLYSALFALTRAVSDNDKAGEVTDAIFFDPEKPMSADEFDKALAEVVGKLPK